MRKLIVTFKDFLMNVAIVLAVFVATCSDRIHLLGDGFDCALMHKNSKNLITLLWSKVVNFVIRLLNDNEYRFFFAVNIVISFFTMVAVKDIKLNIILILLFGVRLLNLFNQVEEKRVWDKCNLSIWFFFFTSCFAIYFVNVAKMVAIDMGLEGSPTYLLIKVVGFLLMFYNLKVLDYRTYFKKTKKASVA